MTPAYYPPADAPSLAWSALAVIVGVALLFDAWRVWRRR